MPVSMLFGVLASRSDWSMLEVLLIGLLGFSGSGQFAALPLSESGAGFFALLLVTASINSRYLPMAFTTIERLPHSAFKRACGAHMLGDEAYASERDDDPPAAVLQIRLVIFLAWGLAGALGVLLSGALPETWLSEDLNLGFPASAVLLYLAVSQLRTRIDSLHRARLIAVAAVALCAAGAGGLILLLGPVYFWVPGVVLASWLLGRLHP
jgi:predicted branched-subunit amino acid permease